MWRIVVLPAPFGPSRPVIPGPRAKVMSLTATTLPYQRETPSSTMAAAGPAGAASALGSGANDWGSRGDPREPADGDRDRADDPDRRRREEGDVRQVDELKSVPNGDAEQDRVRAVEDRGRAEEDQPRPDRRRSRARRRSRRRCSGS